MGVNETELQDPTTRLETAAQEDGMEVSTGKARSSSTATISQHKSTS